MQQQRWETTTTAPAAMLRQVQTKLSTRKKMLLGCALCRLVWDSIPPLVQPIVELTEAYHDRELSPDPFSPLVDPQHQLHQLQAALIQCEPQTAEHSATLAVQGLISSAPIDELLTLVRDWVASAVANQTSPSRRRTVLGLHAALVCDLIREIAGNPFQTHTVVPNWLPQDSVKVPSWIIVVSETARSIAERIQETGDFSGMPILADAVEEAGCTDVPMLRHLRDPEAKHVRGCWALDLILGKS
jgi:hypothetical protein